MYKKINVYSKEDSCSSDESDGEEKEAREVLLIAQEHKNIDIDENDSKGECINQWIERQKKTNMKHESFTGVEDDI